ncbi:putative DNA binding domain-containing protein [bacterium]|nr:putative DNA binding domain-containing protein [bacterium]
MAKEVDSMKKQKLIELINSGECSQVEFKEKVPRPDELASEIVAFANTDGGTVIFGVNDQGEIVGLQFEGNLEEYMMNICRANCLPSIIPAYSLEIIDKKEVAALYIPRGSDRPYRTNRDYYYIRVGTSKRRASKEELLRLFQRAGLAQYDLFPVPKTSIEDINIDLVKEYFQVVHHQKLEKLKIPITDLLKNLEILTDYETDQVCGVAGLLLFGKNPQRHLPQASISLVRYKGEEINDNIIDRAEVGDVLVNQIEESVRFIKKNTRLSSRIVGLKREDIPEYPEGAFREIITNAAAHRDYSIYGSGIRIFIFDHHIEFYSPGRLPNTITIENIEYRRFLRNQVIANFLFLQGYMDRLGMGIANVKRLMKKHCHTEVEFALYEEEFCVRLFGFREKIR